MTKTTVNKESRILQAMKSTLTSVIKDTATEPGFKHPLSTDTVEKLRDCLLLISSREQEIATESGQTMDQRPSYRDRPKSTSGSVVVELEKISKPGIGNPETDN